jgi:hypothetical protein
MATNTQPAVVETELSDFAPKFEPGDFLENFGHGRSHKIRLTDCPLCATDPSRPWYTFGDGECRAEHFAREHGPADV